MSGSEDESRFGCLHAWGITAAIIAVWLAVVTVNQGGVRREGNGEPAEVLTWQGWKAEAEQPMRVEVAPTFPPQPTPVPLLPTDPPVPTMPTVPTMPPPTVVVVLAPPSTQPSPQPDIRVVDDGGPALYGVEPADVSPWTVLGWLLVALVGTAGTLGLILMVDRQLTLTRAQAALIARQTVEQPVVSAQEPPREAQAEQEEEREKAEPEGPVSIEEYLELAVKP